ncbi:hypothetical protein DEJ48_39205 [Streptomyces venezuelae]|uniref:Lipoprotein n=1 Tax=Streptomyces venezuelae TaxID=54571 RepID=A0A5P2C8A7_STRVZ|nr:hypothetical protein [Streptomyces venezuelae]QES38627.1 hypothetical protein DEJ48_39205 [Streptomyces venezuelae]
MRHHLCLRAVTLTAVCLAAALTACGAESGEARAGSEALAEAKDKQTDTFSGLSGAEIADKAISTTAGAYSLRMKGTTPETASGLNTLDMVVTTAGTCAGTVGKSHTGSMQLIITDDTVYRKYDEGLLRAAGTKERASDVEAAVDLLAGHWAKTSRMSEEGRYYVKFCDLDLQMSAYEDADTSTARRDGRAVVDGTPAIKLSGADGKDKFTLYVAREGKPYLLKVVQESVGGKPEALTFSDFDEPVKAKPPTGEIINLDRPPH